VKCAKFLKFEHYTICQMIEMWQLTWIRIC